MSSWGALSIAAAARPDEHDLGQVPVEQQLRHLASVRTDGDARPHEMAAFAAAVEGRREDEVAGGAQPGAPWIRT